MKGGKSNLNGNEEEGGKKKNKAQKMKDAKAKLERDRQFVAKVEEEKITRLNLVDVFVPGGDTEAELVLNGPRTMMAPFVREKRIALWRNVEAGYQGLLVKGREAWEAMESNK